MTTEEEKVNYKDKILEVLYDLLERKKDEYIFLELLYNQITNLEKITQTQKENIEKKEKKKKDFENEKELFISNFMNNYNYYYISDSDIFLEYKTNKTKKTINDNIEENQPQSNEVNINESENEGDIYDSISDYNSDNDTNNYINDKDELYKFNQISENKIWCKISTLLTKNKILMPYKQKVRQEIISKIKKNVLINTIPESKTIQKIISLFVSSITPTKETTKYLLTIIGDALFKKTNQKDEIYFVDSDMYKFLTMLQYYINKYIKCLFLSNFKTKYHNQNYENIRVIRSNKNIDKVFIWENIIKYNIFDIICVAAHYTNRFTNPEQYLEEYCNSIDDINHITYIKERTKEKLVEEFQELYIERNSNLKIKMKEMTYLWKEYLQEKEIPNVIYNNDFHNILNDKYEFIDNNYERLTSPKLNYIKYIIEFMNECFDIINNDNINNQNDGNIIEDDTTPTTLFSDDDIVSVETTSIYTNKYNQDNIDPNNYEISEIYGLFLHWKSLNGLTINISENILLNVIKHFCEEIIVEDNKYVYGLEGKLWNKKNDITEFLSNIDNEKHKTYSKYCKWCKEKGKKFIASKSYFDYVLEV